MSAGDRVPLREGGRTLLIVLAVLVWACACCPAEPSARESGNRERLLMDAGWRFALGHAFEAARDFGHGTGYFSHFAKTGYGDGAAAKGFDDRAWRKLDLPHDWCVELPFDSLGGHSHGYRAIGRSFPGNSVGWYRRSFSIPSSDLGRRISLEFDGVHRNAVVWVNGFYLGTEHSGYTSFSYDITDYLDYGGENTVAVRVDATTEEGWFYEGAGIYRHVWLLKTSPLHVAQYGTFVTSALEGSAALITARAMVVNESSEASGFDLEETILDPAGKTVASAPTRHLLLRPGAQEEFRSTCRAEGAKLWSLETPVLHRLRTVLRAEGKVVDSCTTPFGIRTVRFDPDRGFFLNGKRVELLGTNLHQDHAGVGTAIPDALQEYRVNRLKEMGSNAIRTSHNPPSPALLDACDRLGMLVLDENRLMGTNEEHLSCLERLMKRDRNHPSVVLWSLGNEEWAIEGNIIGARIATTMQAFAQRLDSSRAITAAVSGGWEGGTGTVTQVMGYNYIVQGNIDVHHKLFPWQAGVGTEEATTHQTRGVYETDDRLAHTAPSTRGPENAGTEWGWQFYAARPFLAGLFYWTGFDYRGESNPYEWPAVINQSGSVDLCGFPKDSFYYLQSWWGKYPVLHIATHWNWSKREGQEHQVTVYGNTPQVELLLNGRSLGTREMPRNGHLEWKVNYEPGTLLARGLSGGREILSEKVETAGDPAALLLDADRTTIGADGADVSVITVQAADARGLMVPQAGNEVLLSLEGPGAIIGIGNGDPSSHEPEKFLESIQTVTIDGLKELPVGALDGRPEVVDGFDDALWKPAFGARGVDWRVYTDSLIVVRGSFVLPAFAENAVVDLFTKSIVDRQSVYVNGRLLGAGIARGAPGQAFLLDHGLVRAGRNTFAVTGQRFRKTGQWDAPNTDPGLVRVFTPPGQWKRRLFSGKAQIIVRSAGQPGEITLRAVSPDLKPASIRLTARAVGPGSGTTTTHQDR
jgi:beta-galactosidase